MKTAIIITAATLFLSACSGSCTGGFAKEHCQAQLDASRLIPSEIIIGVPSGT